MTTTTDAVALDYARRMFERQRVPLPPLGFRVDWADQPSRHKLYLDTVKVALPEPFAPPGPDLDLALLASVLACYGLADRRVTPNWNEDSSRKVRAHQAVWSRPTASGGGMYPVESYVVAGAGAPLPPGVYHYDTAHHALDRLSVADRTAALGGATGTATGLYLVAAVRFWKNAFKYNSFCYHVVTQDTGALLGSWRSVLAAAGVDVRPVLWFDDAAVAAALDLDGHTEAPFAVVPLGPAGEVAVDVAPAAPVQRHPVWERSERARTFDLVERVHAAALVGDEPRPDAVVALEPVTGDVVELPAPQARPGDLDLTTSLLRRRSSFGEFAAHPALTTADLGRVLAAVDDAALTGTDVAPSPRPAWIRQWVLANAVDGLEPRAYAYERHRLVAGAPLDVGALQRYYALTNYNLREVAAVLVFTGRLPALVDAYGARGYRMLSIEVGQAAQAAYLAATARGLGVGAVLGIDNLAADELLGIEETDERSMLFVLLGHERAGRPGYDHALRRPPRAPHQEGTPR
ncbi:SagB family peptide dehydrogenase [Jiangella endophytica]|uniref:SagB family peptide dehydrogenase n=1 Tax=Jiangella endophytica TaxID=1623398 RepID=UPI000E34B1E4|nr:SagB family peptide dehydrogenase [Jiangella endophytica]